MQSADLRVEARQLSFVGDVGWRRRGMHRAARVHRASVPPQCIRPSPRVPDTAFGRPEVSTNFRLSSVRRRAARPALSLVLVISVALKKGCGLVAFFEAAVAGDMVCASTLTLQPPGLHVFLIGGSTGNVRPMA